MNKILAFTLVFIFLLSGIAFSEEVVIKLKSGDSISITYTGAIEDISYHGDKDGIAGIVNKSSPKAIHEAGPSQDNNALNAKKTSEEKDTATEKKKGWGLRLKWAEPKDEY
ncbi:MAG: hypothetical protein K6360_05680 [Deltaproteobacteria bacterium]